MDPRTDLVISRLDRLEQKIDILLEQHHQSKGAVLLISIILSLITSGVLTVVLK